LSTCNKCLGVGELVPERIDGKKTGKFLPATNYNIDNHVIGGGDICLCPCIENIMEGKNNEIGTLLQTILKLQKIADEYVRHLEKLLDGDSYTSGSYQRYGKISIGIDSKTFSFTFGPVLSGINRTISLPLDLLKDYGSPKLGKDLATMAKNQKEMWDEERKKNTCSECGNIKSSWNNSWSLYS